LAHAIPCTSPSYGRAPLGGESTAQREVRRGFSLTSATRVSADVAHR
jgi:hypothetical protein